MTSIKQIFFFIFSFILYLITYFIGHYIGVETINGKLTFVVLSIIFTLALYGYVYLTGLFKERFMELEFTPYSCRTGSYMWQGNSPHSQYCKKLASTHKGMAQIQSQSCGKGYINKPKNHFEDTPMSNNLWQNEMCL